MRRLWYVLAVLLLCARPAHAQSDAIAATANAVGDRLDAFRKRDGFPGAMAAFALPDGSIGSVTVGYADPERRIAMTPAHRSMSGSIGKTFVAATALALEHDGRLDLDAPIATWLADEPWFEQLPNAHALTPRILLKHASGLEDHVDQTAFWLDVMWKRLTHGPDAVPTPREMIEVVCNRPPLFEAGKGYKYTDTEYLIIGLILEKVAGRPYYEEVSARFLQPLGLSMTEPSNHRDLKGLVTGHQETIWFLPERTLDADGTMRFNPAAEWTGGGLITTPVDLVRWAKALYEERAMDAPYVEELLAQPSDAGDGFGYGLGVFIYPESDLGPAWGHGGWFPGYRAQMLYYPDLHVAVSMQVNKDGPDVKMNEYAEAIAHAVVDAYHLQRTSEPVTAESN